MAFEIRTSGPDLLDEENRLAFLRIEESIRQYAAHSRESIYLIRRPLSIPDDHIVLLWPRGAAIVGLYAIAGTILGSPNELWRAIPAYDIPDARRDKTRGKQDSSQFFENPYRSLSRAGREFSSLGSTLERPIVLTATAPKAIEPALIALFSLPVDSITLNPPMPKDVPFRTMTVEFATARTIVHLPNLLRAADSGAIMYSSAALQAMADALERAARSNRMASGEQPGTVPTLFGRHPRRQPRWKWILPILVLSMVVIYYVLRAVIAPHAAPPPDTAVSRTHQPSEMIIKLPFEAELLVSPNQYQTHDEFDRALSRGEGQRFLPDTEDIVILDSLALAKGVYGYFRVENAWRKGKLLQTLEPIDTVTIVKFLDPLP